MKKSWKMHGRNEPQFFLSLSDHYQLLAIDDQLKNKTSLFALKKTCEGEKNAFYEQQYCTIKINFFANPLI